MFWYKYLFTGEFVQCFGISIYLQVICTMFWYKYLFTGDFVQCFGISIYLQVILYNVLV